MQITMTTIQIQRAKAKSYGLCLLSLTNEELVHEIGLLEAHLHIYRPFLDFKIISFVEGLIQMAKEEKEIRMVYQGYH